MAAYQPELEVNERTYILQDASSHAQNAMDRSKVASQLSEFPVPVGGDEERANLREDTYSAFDENDPKKGKSSITFTSFNYINSIVGSGVIGMPYALHQAGFGVGIIILVLVAFITDVSLVMMIRAGQIAEVTNYQDLSRVAFGKTGFIVQSLLQFMYPFISLISYNIIVGDTVTKVLIRLTGISPKSVVVRREFIMTTVTLLITLPLSLYRNISRLAKVSLVSVFMIVLIGIAMLTRLYTMKDVAAPTPDAWTFARPDVASAIGIMSFAFMCHHSSFLVYESLQDNTQQRWNRATHASIAVATILSLIYSVSGYVTFTGYVQGDIFENYCWRDDLMNLCRAFYAVTILFTYPIECFVSREVLENAFFSAYQPQPIFRHAVLTVLIALFGYLFSLTTDCLGLILELNGIFCALPLAYILPSLNYIKLEEGQIFCRRKWKAWIVAIFGGTAMLAGIVTLVIRYDSLSQCSHGKEMFYCSIYNNSTIRRTF